MQKYAWTREIILEALNTKMPKYKYMITDDPAEFIYRMETIIECSFKASGDNL
jgi:hypothetical protein